MVRLERWLEGSERGKGKSNDVEVAPLVFKLPVDKGELVVLDCLLEGVRGAGGDGKEGLLDGSLGELRVRH